MHRPCSERLRTTRMARPRASAAPAARRPTGRHEGLAAQSLAPPPGRIPTASRPPRVPEPPSNAVRATFDRPSSCLSADATRHAGAMSPSPHALESDPGRARVGLHRHALRRAPVPFGPSCDGGDAIPQVGSGTDTASYPAAREACQSRGWRGRTFVAVTTGPGGSASTGVVGRGVASDSPIQTLSCGRLGS